VHARDVAARPVQAGDKTLSDRIASGREHDRHTRGCALGRKHRHGIPDNQVHRPVDQLIHQSRQSIGPALCPAEFDRNILALDVARVLQALAERCYELRCVRRRRAAQKSDHRHRLLRAVANGTLAAAPPTSVINSRRCM
jgi:hypothetical protein